VTDIASDGLPHCTTCSDMRWVRADVPVGHPDFGRLALCPDCGQGVQRQQATRLYRALGGRIQRYESAGVKGGRQTFATFDRGGGNGCAVTIQKAYGVAHAFAIEPKGWLALSGSRGTGKSHLAAAIAHHLSTVDGPEWQRPTVLFLTVPDFLDLLRSGYKRGDYDDLLELCRQVDVLILDDLGAEAETDWTHEKLFQVLDGRYRNQRPTVVATNCRLEELEPRVYDRLSDDDLCKRAEIVAPSYRQRRSAPGVIV